MSLHVFGILIAASASQVWAESYTVKGTVQYQALTGSSYREEYLFTVAVDECDWAIEMRPTGDPVSETYSKSLKTRVMNRGSEVVALTKNRESYKGQDGVVFVAEDDPLPPSEPPGLAQHLWLAYASHCYLRDATNHLISPVGHLPRHYRQYGFRTPAEWVCDTRAPNLLIRINYYFDHAEWKAFADPNGPQGHPHSGVRVDLPTRILWARYEAGPVRNWSGLHVPSSFRFTGYEAFAELSRPGKRLAVLEVTGSTTQVTAGVDRAMFSPVFDGVAVVDDYRFWKPKMRLGVNYMITNSAPPPRVDGRLVNLAHRREAMQDRRRSDAIRVQSQGEIIFSIFTLFATVSIGYVLFTNKKQRIQTSNEKSHLHE